MKIGLQIYSLREALETDYANTLRQVKAIGYTGAEIFGRHLPASETKALFADTKLEIIGHHFSLPDLEKDLVACIARTKEVGTDNLVCSWSMPSQTQSWQAILESLQKIRLAAQASGLNFLYHNHDHEISQNIANKRVLDAILEICDSELDIAWVHAGGASPTAYLEQNASKIKLLHIKDVRLENQKWETVNFGTGTVPLTECLAAAKKTSSQWLIIEQDDSPDPMQSAKHNFEWLKTALGDPN